MVLGYKKNEEEKEVFKKRIEEILFGLSQA